MICWSSDLYGFCEENGEKMRSTIKHSTIHNQNRLKIQQNPIWISLTNNEWASEHSTRQQSVCCCGCVFMRMWMNVYVCVSM